MNRRALLLGIAATPALLGAKRKEELIVGENSYVTAAEADAYFAQTYGPPWNCRCALKPVIYGEVRNYEPTLIEPNRHIFQYHVA